MSEFEKNGFFYLIHVCYCLGSHYKAPYVIVYLNVAYFLVIIKNRQTTTTTKKNPHSLVCQKLVRGKDKVFSFDYAPLCLNILFSLVNLPQSEMHLKNRIMVQNNV